MRVAAALYICSKKAVLIRVEGPQDVGRALDRLRADGRLVDAEAPDANDQCGPFVIVAAAPIPARVVPFLQTPFDQVVDIDVLMREIDQAAMLATEPTGKPS